MKALKTTTGHFYASSLGQWQVNTNLDELLRTMRRDSLPFAVWYVPVSVDSAYKIRRYAPQVEGAVWIGSTLEGK